MMTEGEGALLPIGAVVGAFAETVWRDLPGAAVLGGIFVGLLVVAELWRRLGEPDPEHTRKLVHLGGGIACLFFPFLVDSPVTVLVMAGAMSAVFALGGRWGLLQSLHGVGRPSRGAEYYPLAIFLVFLLVADRPALYVSSVLVLAMADAFAALVGSRYGSIRYEVEEESKSLEGSIAFLVIAFLSIHLPLLLMTELPRALCVLAALLVATLVTGFEAISLRGADNLFVPLAVAVILGKITSKPLGEVVFQNVSLLVLCLVLALVVRRARSFNAGGAIAFMLFTYGTWSLGSWHWALPVVTGFGCFSALWLWRRPDRPPGVRVRAVARALLVPFAVLAVNNSLHLGPTLFGPYVTACGAVLALSLPLTLKRGGAEGAAVAAEVGGGSPTGGGSLTRVGGAMAGALLAWAATALPCWFMQRGVSPVGPAVAAVAVLAAALGAYVLDPRGPRPQTWTARRFLLSLGAAVLVLALQVAGLAPVWDPSWMRRLGFL